MSENLRIVFFGSPDFAVPALKALVDGGHEVAAVVTQPDRPKGRGRKTTPPPVKSAALELGLEVFQPANIKTEDFFDAMSKISPDLFVVVAFGQLLPQRLLDVPEKGAINIHGSLLPKYRGPAPIQWAIINGETETGVTTMYMEKKLDAGDMLLWRATPIYPDDTAGSLHDRLSQIGAELLAETLDRLEKGNLNATAQDPSQATYAPMLEKNDGRIDWEKPAQDIERFIRGMSPWPGAFTFLDKKRLKIFKAQPAAGEKDVAPGTILKGFENELRVAAGDGSALSVVELQGASGKRMNIENFLRGNAVAAGAVLS